MLRRKWTWAGALVGVLSFDWQHKGRGLYPRQRWALKALGQHCAFSMEPSFVVCIYCPGLLLFFRHCVCTFLNLALDEVNSNFVLMHLLIMSSNSNWRTPCNTAADPLLNRCKALILILHYVVYECITSWQFIVMKQAAFQNGHNDWAYSFIKTSSE